ncbi:TetR/AcrR family transcriptional regulator C-terminal domain-containing protein [Raineyella sp. W15-4]|uniref:TetR/AcrR family transcriptional regulator C-terminal domain-containing protein n=1 Tax=Raineyella sp. W15-4 TaxID=3081651 RepID=UPI0029549EBA|nr:TetR/AcrR family transcriptional regulator C-terminal domain-containing protein [Raineyella sp. W15-4]WOQ17715.1 TetR/AcrR family transcriptional regulator C-terminal domain-containing protein [Raineyella sp. W15-4]
MSLSRADVLAKAVEILDAYGLADLTMRRLATALHVQPGALYWHYANKQELLAAVTDRILAGVCSPGPDDTWQQALLDWSVSLRATLLAHRDGADLTSSAVALSLGALRPQEPLVRLLTAAGLGSADAEAIGETALHLTLGLTLNEQSRAQAAALGVIAGPAPDDRARLELGIDLLARGVSARFGI